MFERTVHPIITPVVTSMHQGTRSSSSVQNRLTTASLEPTTPLPEAPLMLTSEVVPKMYNGSNVTETPWMDESNEWELCTLVVR